MKLVKSFLLFGILSLLVACGGSTTPSKEPVNFTVATTKIAISDQASIVGRFEDKALRDQTIATLKPSVQAGFDSVAGGAQKATAIVTIQTMRLRDAGSRTFGGSNEISAVVQIVDASGNDLVQPYRASYFNQGAQPGTINGNPLAGLIINAAVNSARQDAGKDVETLIAGFVSDVVSAM